jgi:hypothetical protein
MCQKGKCPWHLIALKSKSILYKLVTFLQRLQRLKQEWQENPAGTRHIDGKILVWFGELERKLAKSSKTTFTYCSPS